MDPPSEAGPSGACDPEMDASAEDGNALRKEEDDLAVSPDCGDGYHPDDEMEDHPKGSPMQQSPDQSNISDRSPEAGHGNNDNEEAMDEDTADSAQGAEQTVSEMSDDGDDGVDTVTSGVGLEHIKEGEEEGEEDETSRPEPDESTSESSVPNPVDSGDIVSENITSTSEQAEECDSQIADHLTDIDQTNRCTAEDSSDSEQGIDSSSKLDHHPKAFENQDLDSVSDDEVSVKSDTEGCERLETKDKNVKKNSISPDTSIVGPEVDIVRLEDNIRSQQNLDSIDSNDKAHEAESDDDLDLTSQDDTDVSKANLTDTSTNHTKYVENNDKSIPETTNSEEMGVDAKSPERPGSPSDEPPDSAEKESDAKSEASLEEVSDEEGEEVEEEEKGGVGDGSGIEEVSDEEEEEEEEVERKEKSSHPDLEEGEHEPQSGVEEVSDESSAEEEPASVEGDGECTDSEGMEDISSEEEEAQEEEEKKEPDDDRNTDGDVVSRTRKVEVKQNGEVVSIDDTGKDDGTIVQEILENMTIKVDMGQIDPEGRGAVSRRDRCRDRKDRKDSTRSRGSMRDINERLKVQASYGEDVELDYDDVHDDTKDKQGSGEEGALSTDESDEGELEEEEDCEEGEIREPGSKPFVKPTCRFYMRGHCTWGTNCRFLHPGINDKGNYQLIERPGFNNKPRFEEPFEEEERSPSPEPPPPPTEPKEETAWERGLRQAKELRKKALERRELEPNFEQKKLILSIDENPEYNKENTLDKEERSPKKKQSYYDKLEPLSDDEYYDQTPVRLQQKQQSEQMWSPGQYENFEVRWTSRDQYYMPPPPQSPYGDQGPPPQRYPHMYPPNHPAYRGRGERYTPTRPAPRQYSPSPPPQQPYPYRYQRLSQPNNLNRTGLEVPHQQYPRQTRDPHDMRREKMKMRPESPPLQKPMGPSPNHRPPRADEWHDPWTRSNVQRGKSPVKKRSRSRGRRRSRRSHSYSSSYSSSSYSGSSRSRSRSSSMSSISSRSHSRSRSSSFSSRSPSPRRNEVFDRRRPPMPSPQDNRRPPPQRGPPRPGDPRSGMPHGHPNRSPEKRPGMPLSPMKGPKGHQPFMDPHGRGHPMGGRGGPPPQDRRLERPPPQPQRKFQLEIKPRDRPLPPSALNRDKPRRPHDRGNSSSSSRSRSRSSSSSSRSSRSSFSSRSSRSSSSSSSGSADSDHLYRKIGGRDPQKPPREKSRGGRSPGQDRRPMASKPGPRMGGLRQGEFGKAVTAPPQKPKDPLKMTGQKSNIKLTLIKPNEKAGGGRLPDSGSKKRPADLLNDGPPQKRQNMASSARIDKPVKKVDKAGPPSPVKAAGRGPGPVKPPPPVVTAPPPAAPAVKKKSTVSRREELLKQLKAVEDAIAKKKKKMN